VAILVPRMALLEGLPVIAEDLLEGVFVALLTVLKKWTFDLSMTKVALRRQIFEANVNWFTLILQVHGTKPLDDPVQQASVRLG